MIDKNTFMETVRSVADIVKMSDIPLSKEEIAGYFKDMELSSDQQEMIWQYFQQPDEKIRIKEFKEQDSRGPGTGVELPKNIFFRMYLEDMEKIKPCTLQEEEIYYKRLVEGDDTVIHKLSEQWLSRVLNLARKCAVSVEELPDVIQEGNIGVFLTLEELCGSGKRADYVQIITDAVNAAMEKYLQNSDAAKEMEQSVLVKASLVYEARKIMTEKIQRIPTMTELSQYTKIPQEELEDILAVLEQKK